MNGGEKQFKTKGNQFKTRGKQSKTRGKQKKLNRLSGISHQLSANYGARCGCHCETIPMKSGGEAIRVGCGALHLPDCHVAPLLAMTGWIRPRIEVRGVLAPEWMVSFVIIYLT